MISRSCIDCSGSVSAQARTGRCAKCSTAWVNSDPGIAANRKRAIREHYKNPANRAKNARRLTEYVARGRSDPALVAKWTANIMKGRQRLNDPDVLAKMAACRAENGRKRHETVMRWCPPEYRAEYKRLTISRKMRAADARRVIEERMRLEMTPFSRAMERVRKGAQIAAAHPMPSKAYAYTLGGVSSI